MQKWEGYFDNSIRLFLYVLIFWLPYSEGVVECCVGIALILWLAKQVILRRIRIVASPLNYPILAFMISCIISVILSQSAGQSWYNFLTKTMEWFIIYFLTLEVFKTKRQIYIAIGILLFTSLAVYVDSFIQYYVTGKDIFFGYSLAGGLRATASFEAANGLGAYWVMVIPMVATLCFARRIFLILLFLFIWSIILTFSRGAWIGMGAGIVFMFYLMEYMTSISKKFVYRMRIAILIFIVICLSLFILKGKSIEALNRSSSWRFSIWKHSLEMVKERPFFGHGINTYMKLFVKYRPKHIGIFDYDPTYAHNCYLQLLCETGITGLITFLSIISALFYSALKQIYITKLREKDLFVLLTIGILCGIFSFLVHSFFDTHFYSLKLSAYLWIMIGLLFACLTILKKEKVEVSYGKA